MMTTVHRGALAVALMFVAVHPATGFVAPCVTTLNIPQRSLALGSDKLAGWQTARPVCLGAKNRRDGARVAIRMSGMAVPDEDDWYESDSWESFRKSGAKRMDPQAKRVEQEGKRSSEEAGSRAGEQQQEGKQPKKGKYSEATQWIQIGGSEVCLPRDLRKPLDGPRFFAVVHFIGGVFVGSIPKLAYQPFIEALVANSRVVVVATPCSGLSGMDHYKAAYEAAFKFQTACDLLKAELGADVFDADCLPSVGVGHSLGCKVQILLNSVEDARKAAGRPRVANVHMAFNNFGAKQSIPVLSELGNLQKSFYKGVAEVAPVLDGVNNFAKEIQKSAELKSMLGNAGVEKAFDFIDKLSNTAKQAANNVQGDVLEEFVPSPDDTFKLLDLDYVTSRNLVVKFTEDTIDQSIPLCEALRKKFTDKVTGIGGRLELKRLPGSHVTPNTPDLADLATGRSSMEGLEAIEEQSRAKAKEAMQQVEGVAAVVGSFIREEALAEGYAPRSRKRMPEATGPA